MSSYVDAELWKVCAGGMVSVPVVNSKVMYFPQGHVEYANGAVDFCKYPEVPAFVNCRVASVKYMANVEMDDLYLRMRLVPVKMEDVFMEYEGDDDLVECLSEDRMEKCSSFTKILTQSDANNGGGFSVPRYCADSIFPKLNYKADPPVQNLFLKDVHGVLWKFRHIYRGTPRRHLLTTGWSNFVNDKKLVAGDSVIFLKAGDGELCIGIKRATRGVSMLKSKRGLWESPRGVCNSLFGNGSKGGSRKNGKVSVETVVETARRAAAGREFEVDYYPRAGCPEFCVKSSVVIAALRIKWCAGMKFKMAFECEDASKDNLFVGTIQAVQAADPVRWPKSPWRMLQVMWDEPTLTDNVDRVSPWSVDVSVGGMLNMNTLTLIQPMKRLRLTQPPELTLHNQHQPPFPDQFFRNLSLYPVADKTLTGIQGARHVQYGNYPSNLHPNSHMFPQFKLPFTAPLQSSVGVNFRGYKRNEVDTARLWTSSMSPEEPESNAIVLFGKRIVLEERKSQSSPAAIATPVSNSVITCDGNIDKVKSGTDSSESVSVHNEMECSSDRKSNDEIEMDPQTPGA